MGRKRDLAERFWEKVDKSGACWTWTASRKSGGMRYGTVGVRVAGKSLSLMAHRVSWGLVNGAIPTGMCVLHRCDNAICVNPEHLFLGTQSDNIYDMLAKGRHGKATKLLPNDVAAIRAQAAAGLSVRGIARSSAVGRTTVADVLAGRRYAEVSHV